MNKTWLEFRVKNKSAMCLSTAKLPLFGKPLFASLLVGLVVALVYSRSFCSEFVFDARVQILSHDYIHTPANLWDVVTMRVMGQDVLDFNRPEHLQWLMIESILFGRDPRGYHVTSILLHAINAGLLTYVVAKIVREYVGQGVSNCGINVCCGLGVLIAMLHPLLLEAVAEPSFREDPLATFFMWLALLLATSLRPGGKHSIWIGLGIAWCSLDAIASKETGVATPVALAAYFLFVRRTGFRTYWIIPWLGSALVCLAFVAARFGLAPSDSEIFRRPPPPFADSLSTYLQFQGSIWRLYVQQLFWPDRQCVHYTPYFARSFTNLQNWSIILGFVAAQVVLAWRSRLAALGSVIFWAGLLPASNALPQYVPAADRYLYMPFTGLALIATAILLLAWRYESLRKPVMILAGAAIVALAAATWHREFVFSSDLALWQDATSKNPDSYSAENGLAWAYYRAGNRQLAKLHFDLATILSPAAADPFLGRAALLNDAGETNSADEEFLIAVQVDPLVADPDEGLRRMALDIDQVRAIRPIAARFLEQKTAPPKSPIDIPD